MTGPTGQPTLVQILLGFRGFRFAITADVEKMYRKIKIRQPYTDLQRIVWKADATKPLKHYTLNTVTYGTSADLFSNSGGLRS